MGYHTQVIILGEKEMLIMVKDGYKTTEFWLATAGILVTAILGLLVGYGLLTSEQAELWAGLSVPLLSMVIAAISIGYSTSRGRVKVAAGSTEG